MVGRGRRSAEGPGTPAIRDPGPSLLRQRAAVGRRRDRSGRYQPGAGPGPVGVAQRADRTDPFRPVPDVMTMTDDLLHAKDARGVATVTLNRPQLHNAFDDALI